MVPLGPGVAAYAQELPPIPASLRSASGVVCIKISDDGFVAGAFVFTSTGNAQADDDLLLWVRQLRWGKAAPGEPGRNTWFAMPVAFGGAALPEPPENCPEPAADHDT